MTREELLYQAMRQDVLQFSNELTRMITHYMALVRIIVAFLVALPFHIALSIITHLLVLLVSVFQDTALYVMKCYLDFQQEARGNTL